MLAAVAGWAAVGAAAIAGLAADATIGAVRAAMVGEPPAPLAPGVGGGAAALAVSAPAQATKPCFDGNRSPVSRVRVAGSAAGTRTRVSSCAGLSITTRAVRTPCFNMPAKAASAAGLLSNRPRLRPAC